MELIMIAAVAENNVIGKSNSLLWNLRADLKRFKELTMGKPVIMGRKTFDSVVKILGKPLPGRTNIVITSQALKMEGVVFVNSVEKAVEEAKKHGEIAYVIGGQKVYGEMIDLVDKLEITEVHKSYEGDAFFPKIDEKWREIKREDGEENGLKYSWVTYVKNSKKGLFITFEGIDGSGKSTQMKKFVDYLFSKNKHNHIVLTREPYQETNVRKILYESADPLSQAEKLAELFVNDRKKHAQELIIPNINKGVHVISDRYKLSTVSYQSAQGMDINKLIEMHVGLPVPDFTFIIDVSSQQAAKRMQGEEGRKAHKFEANLEFLENVRKNFHKAKELLKNEKIFVINGERNVEEIFSEIISIFEGN